ncbi:MAG: flagellar biosynthetic protein FliR [Deltaproteobacteria bacterium HGW-Deltaproteobacteria-10]|nr:MAG: flagellar biosynthetic protein FliR [Deltaproteobacteria bacterium HGW-Deltaproteobacteria-10]
MSLPFLSAEHLEAFILVLLRVSALVVTIPVISDKAVPARFKAALCILISLIIFPLVLSKIPPASNYPVLILMYRMAGEVMIGLIIGFAARFILAGIQMAGDIIGFQMGLSIANVIDPTTSTQVSIITELQYLVALLIFLAVDAHHIFFSAIIQSYSLLNPLAFHFSGSLMQAIFSFSQEMFVIAVKLAAPIMAVMLFTNVGLGIVARTVPQINIFIVGMPLQIAIGLIFLGLTAPMFVKLTQGYFLDFESKLVTLLRLM